MKQERFEPVTSTRRPAQPTGTRTRLTAAVVTGVALVASSLLLTVPRAVASSTATAAAVSTQNTAVTPSPVPSALTPSVNNGVVDAIAQVGNKIILGGSFTTVSPLKDLPTVYPLAYVFAFDATTGAIDHTGFTPKVDGTVETIEAGPAPNEVYIGGDFKTVDGKKMKIALLDTTTGDIVPGWNPSPMDGATSKILLEGGRLFVGGIFTTVGGQDHGGLVALDPTTGAVTNYVSLDFIGHHNYGINCDPTVVLNCATGGVGLKSFDINSAGTMMVAVGDFTSVAGQPRDQIARINLTSGGAIVDPDWATLAYSAACITTAFDSYIRDVQFSPNGDFFVVVASGGAGQNVDGTRSSCDAATRWETNGTGTNVRPTWTDYTGKDSLWSLAVTNDVIYTGGHQRWLNNTFGADAAGEGAVPRPGLAALNVTNGLPLAWNPGRNPRGAGAYAFLATSQGVYVGSDTNYIGNYRYNRPKIAFFPFANGERLPDESTPSTPGRIFMFGNRASGAGNPNRVVAREFDGSTFGQEVVKSTGGTAWGSVRGAFTVNGSIVYGMSDGYLYRQTYNGNSFGPAVKLDPYDDPAWDDVLNGTLGTYQGLTSNFAADLPTVTSMFFNKGRLFYTQAGRSTMHWRWYEPDDGIVGADEYTVGGSQNWSATQGAFLYGNKLYYSDASSHQLHVIGWAGTQPSGSASVANSATDWSSAGLLELPSTDAPTASPVAKFEASCPTGPVCAFTATPWTDPDGGVVQYAWSFGDGTTQAASDSTEAKHTFAKGGVHHVTLTVSTTSGQSTREDDPLDVKAPLAMISFVGATSATGVTKTTKLTVPKATKAGDGLVLFDSFASTKARVKIPKGWKSAGTTRRHGLTTVVISRPATIHSAGSTVTLRYTAAVHSVASLGVYDGTADVPVGKATKVTGAATKAHPAPRLPDLSSGQWVVGYWAETSATAAGWTPPSVSKRRTGAHLKPGPYLSSVTVDTGTPPPLGPYLLGTARSSRPALSAAAWAIALTPRSL
jgi:hypothetical protein